MSKCTLGMGDVVFGRRLQGRSIEINGSILPFSIGKWVWRIGDAENGYLAHGVAVSLETAVAKAQAAAVPHLDSKWASK